MERFTFTVGKLDAGMAILIGERAHLIEFPSLLLPPGVTSGSIVNISVDRNTAAEQAQAKEFWSLQDSILQEYGLSTPQPPQLKLRHVTQTSVTLEWQSLDLAKAKLRSLEILKNGTRLATIPNPTVNTSTKLSSLQMNEEYSFQLILKTTAGTYPSNIIRVRTHTLQDTSGISVCFGTVEDPQLLTQAKAALEKMNAKWTEKIQIDTTQFVCTTPMAMGQEEGQKNGYGSMSGGTAEYQKAMQLSLPVVQPQWILACHGEKKLVPVSSYQLGSAPIQSFSTAPFSRSPNQPGSPRQSSMTTAAHSASIQRAPSPETIARMSINTSSSPSSVAGGSGSPSSNVALKVVGRQSTERGGDKDVEQVVRPKSPRSDVVGKLDRGFKFPTGSPIVSGANGTSLGDTVDASSVPVPLAEQDETGKVVAVAGKSLPEEPQLPDNKEPEVVVADTTPTSVDSKAPSVSIEELPPAEPAASTSEENPLPALPLEKETVVEDQTVAESVVTKPVAEDLPPVVAAPQDISTELDTSIVAEEPVSEIPAAAVAAAVAPIQADEPQTEEEPTSASVPEPEPEVKAADSAVSITKKKKGKKKKAGGRKTDEAADSPKEIDDIDSGSKDVD